MASPQLYRLALIGFGAVGQGLARILRDHGARIAEQYGARFQITAVATRTRGSLVNPEGYDPAALLASFDTLPGAGTLMPLDLIAQAAADVLVELSPTDMATAEPATSHVRAAFARGMHVVLANKGPVARHFAELQALAAQHQLVFGYEATVMGGTPALWLGQRALAGCDIQSVQGIVNGTTNFILTQMERGGSYADALAEAQRLGYAEADPSGDVEGVDAAGKAAILANVLFGTQLFPEQVETTGITGITREMVAAATSAGERYKLIASVWRDGQTVRARVEPERLMLTHPLAGVAGALNALTYSTDLLGDVTLIGPGAGGVATGFAVLSDLLAINRG